MRSAWIYLLGQSLKRPKESLVPELQPEQLSPVLVHSLWLFLLADPFHGGKLTPGSASPPLLGHFLCCSNPLYHQGP